MDLGSPLTYLRPQGRPGTSAPSSTCGQAERLLELRTAIRDELVTALEEGDEAGARWLVALLAFVVEVAGSPDPHESFPRRTD